MVLSVERIRGKQVIAARCERAESGGVEAGMDLAHARSLLHGMCTLVEPFTPEEDTRRLEALARWALRFSPVAAPDPPDGLLLDLGGCERLYPSQRRLLDGIERSLARMGFPARLAVAPTFACARAVARYGGRRISIIQEKDVPDVLAPLPIEALRLDSDVCEALTEVGVETVGQLLALPRDELAARFGAEILRRLDRATGRIEERIEPLRPPRRYEVAHAFEGAVSDGRILSAVVRKLLDELAQQLRADGRGALRLKISFDRVRNGPVHLSLRLTHPSNSAKHLWSLLRGRLERINIGYGAEEVHVTALRTGRMAEAQDCFWSDVDRLGGQRADSAAWGELLDELLARLGSRAVVRLRPAATYVPEEAFQRIPPETTVRHKQETIHPAGRPSRLFARPERVEVITLLPDHPPAHLTWRGRQRAVLAGCGPERIALPWWSGGGETPTRDYYVVQDEAGRWLWLYHDLTAGGWFVHGEWA